MNKCLSLFLSASMLLSGGAALAETTTSGTIDYTKTGSITLYKLQSKDGLNQEGSGVEGENWQNVASKPLAGVEFSYVKVGDLVNSKTGVQMYYSLTPTFTSFANGLGVTIDSVNDGGQTVYTPEAINKAMAQILNISAGYGDAIDGSTSGDEQTIAFTKTNGQAMPVTGQDGKTTVGNLPLGLYLVAETATPADVHDGVTQSVSRPSVPFLMALPMTNITEIVNADGTHAPGTVWQYDVTAYPKNEMINIRKDIIADGNDAGDAKPDANGLVTVTDKNVGDQINHLLTFDVPALQPMSNEDGTITPNKHRKFIITDKMTGGIEIRDTTNKNFKITLGTGAWNDSQNKELLAHDGLAQLYNIVADPDNHGFTITFTEAGLAELDKVNVDSKLYVNYKSDVVKEAVTDKTGAIKEDNNVTKLTYGTSASKDYEFGSNKDVKNYTYELDLTKTFTGNVADKSAVSFIVEADGADLLWVKEADGVYHLYDKHETNADGSAVELKTNQVVRCDVNGKLILKGLDARTYTLTEKSTARGYNLLKDSIDVTLEKAAPEDGTLSAASVSIGKETPISITEGLATGQVNITINNNETITVLRTGGEGWNNTMLAGGMIVLAGGAVLMLMKRNKAEEC